MFKLARELRWRKARDLAEDYGSSKGVEERAFILFYDYKLNESFFNNIIRSSIRGEGVCMGLMIAIFSVRMRRLQQTEVYVICTGEVLFKFSFRVVVFRLNVIHCFLDLPI